MNCSMAPVLHEKTKMLLRSLEARESLIYELGTPQLIETEEVTQLIEMGPKIIPCLIELAESGTPKSVAYIVLVLGKLGDRTVVDVLREFRAKYQIPEHKTEWEYAVIGQCNLAIEALEAD